MEINVNNLLDQLSNIVFTYGPKLLGGILVWIIGSFVIKILMRSFSKMMDKRETDSSLKPFLMSLIGSSFKNNVGY